MSDISLSYLEPEDVAGGTRIRLTTLVLVGVALLVIAVVGVSLLRVGQVQPRTGPAPTFAITMFDGEEFSLADQRGKVVVVNFWASWCVPCRDEAPILQRVWERYRERGVVMVGLAYLDVEADALAFIDEFGISYPNGLDLGKAIAKRYRIKGVPETFIMDQQSNIVEFYAGPAAEGQLDAILDRLLAG